MALHVRSHTNKKIVCNFCGEPQVTQDLLSRHLDKYHRDHCAVCDQCRKVFSSKRELSSHRRAHTNETKDSAKKKKVAKKGGKKKTNKSVKCEICDQVLSSLHFYNLHFKHRHATPQTFKCEYCDFSSAYKSNVTKHKLEHNEANLVGCVVCNEKFDKRYIGTHIKTHEVSHDCNYCGKIFAGKRNLNAHKRMHTTEGSYKCQICDETFTQETKLKTHVETVHAKMKKRTTKK